MEASNASLLEPSLTAALAQLAWRDLGPSQSISRDHCTPLPLSLAVTVLSTACRGARASSSHNLSLSPVLASASQQAPASSPLCSQICQPCISTSPQFCPSQSPHLSSRNGVQVRVAFGASPNKLESSHATVMPAALEAHRACRPSWTSSSQPTAT